jgi:thioredoxin-like negative regulator of GroEL
MSVRPIQALAGRSGARAQRLIAIMVAPLLLAACATPVAPPPSPGAAAFDPAAMLAAVRAAGAHDHSVLQVHPLRSPGVAALVRQADAAAAQGDYAGAARLLDRALQFEPHAPDLLQARAEMALAQGDWTLARQALRRGPRSGALCARGWQTLVEVARVQRDAAAQAQAEQRVAACHEPEPAWK